VSDTVEAQSSDISNRSHSYIVPGLGDFGDRFYTL
jgi:uracil phosphoribosyltransferase